MREQDYTVTMFSGSGRDGPVQLLFIQVPRRQTNTVIAAVRKFDPSCFYTVDDVRLASSALAARPHVSHDHLA
jgi:uncharacterized protein YebE (UPF0316 family)